MEYDRTYALVYITFINLTASVASLCVKDRVARENSTGFQTKSATTYFTVTNATMRASLPGPIIGVHMYICGRSCFPTILPADGTTPRFGCLL